jgi:hypothetical protein
MSKTRYQHFPVWLIYGAFGVTALSVLYALTHLLLPEWPPRVVCESDACKEAREWIAYSVTILVLLGGMFQYWRSQLWKRAEFVAEQMEAFFGRKPVRRATTMIDWARRRIDLYDRPTEKPQTWPLVTRRLQSRALLPHTVVNRVARIVVDDPTHKAEQSTSSIAIDGELAEFARTEAAIRDDYDALFDGIETFSSYVSSGLVTHRDLRAYLGYWVDDICSRTNDPEDDLWTCCILSYIEFYRFTGVQELFDAFGHDIRPEGFLFVHFLSRLSDDEYGIALKELWAKAGEEGQSSDRGQVTA